MTTELTIENFVDIPKIENDCARATFLLNRLIKTVKQLKAVGIDVAEVNVTANDTFMENLLL